MNIEKFLDPNRDKFTIEYYKKYGVRAAIDSYSLPSKFTNKEQLYKECISKNKRWEDIIKPIPKNAVL